MPGMCTGKRRLHFWFRQQIIVYHKKEKTKTSFFCKNLRLGVGLTYHDNVMYLFDQSACLFFEKPFEFVILCTENIKNKSKQTTLSSIKSIHPPHSAYQVDYFFFDHRNHLVSVVFSFQANSLTNRSNRLNTIATTNNNNFELFYQYLACPLSLSSLLVLMLMLSA